MHTKQTTLSLEAEDRHSMMSATSLIHVHVADNSCSICIAFQYITLGFEFSKAKAIDLLTSDSA